MTATEHPTVEAAKVRAASAPRESLRARGVVHTPIALSRFGLARVDAWLRDAFGLAAGLSDPRALVLDPAVGTGVWLAAALELGAERTGHAFARTWWGFDVDQDALQTCGSLLAGELARQDVKLTLRCENTLAIADPWPSGREGVRVVIGNPPWAARSLSRGTALSDAWLAEFRRDAEGKPLAERRVGVLSDDYVRFFRWTLEQARTAPAGAVFCLASNGSFLDGPVHRGMRAALRAAFDQIEVIDLGGNALLSRGGERDQNVFGVRVGAALTLGFRRPRAGTRLAQVRVSRVVGTREEKLEQLAQLAFSEIDADPAAPWTKPEVRAARAPKREEFSIAEAFPFHREGVQTNRDELATAASREELFSQLARIAEGELALVSSSHFDPARARAVARAVLQGEHDDRIRRLAYRPLETRVVCAVSPLCHRPRPDLLRATAHGSLSLLAARKDRGSFPFSLFGAARDVADACFLSTRSSCRTRVFPSHDPDGQPNLSAEVRSRFADLSDEAGPEQVILFALGVLCSARFRGEQGERLKRDYPRIPLPRSAAAISAFCAAGELSLEALDPACEEAPTTRPGAVACCGSNMLVSLRRVCFDPERRQLMYDGTPLITGVSSALWQSTIGHVKWSRLAAARSRARPKQPMIADQARAHELVESAALARVLRHAERWLEAAALADRAFASHFG